MLLRQNSRRVSALIAVLAVTISGGVAMAGPATEPSILIQMKMPADAAVINGRSPLPRGGEMLEKDIAPPAAEGKSRGIVAVNVYPKVAPAVVVVCLPDGHGSGFVVDPEGWIITNNHVAAESEPDVKTGERTVNILFGRLVDGWMKPLDEKVPARVCKLDPVKDLALLKLVSKPSELKEIPWIALAEKVPPPGSECVAIGHPATSALWSVREGALTGFATWPDQAPEVVYQRLALSRSGEDELSAELKHAPKREVLYSDTDINKGDSGGPLVDRDGKLIGVTFAMPVFTPGDSPRQGATSMHIHLDEVRDFLKDKPTTPIMAYDAWPDDLMGAFGNVMRGRRPDTLVFSPDTNSPPEALLADLKGESEPGVTIDQLSDPSERGKWRFQFAIHLNPDRSIHRVFYDTANSGKIDLILTDLDGDGRADVAVRLGEDGQWHIDPDSEGRMIDPNLFTDRDLREQFQRYLQGLGRMK